MVTTPQASRHATDRIVAPPYRALDAGLRPGPFPDRAASLLPGLLAATRTGLPPAGDDELTNTKIHHGTTSRLHLPPYWAHITAHYHFLRTAVPERWVMAGIGASIPALRACCGQGLVHCLGCRWPVPRICRTRLVLCQTPATRPWPRSPALPGRPGAVTQPSPATLRLAAASGVPGHRGRLRRGWSR